MAISPEQIAQLRTSAGLAPTPAKANVPDVLAQRKAALGMVEQKPTLFQDISKDIKNRGEAFHGNITGTSPESQGESASTRGVQAAANAFGGVADVGIDIASRLIPESVKNEFRNPKPSKLRESVKSGYSEIMDKVGIGLDDLIQRFPEVGHGLETALKKMGALGEISGTILGAEGFASSGDALLSKSKNVIDTGINTAKNVKDTVSGKVSNAVSGNAQNDLQLLKEKITPKPTVKEAKLATEQGRLYKGNDPTTFKSGTPDRVSTTDQQMKSVQTVNKLIPEHAVMNEPQLYSAIKEKIGETAKALKPEMQKVKVKPETFDTMSNDWKNIKSSQNNNAYTPNDVNVKKLQTQFEERLKNVKDGSLDDVWDARKAYDDSVPDNVKRANDLSSESLLAKKDMWLENRKIFSDAINNAENGLGDVSKQAFSDMRDLYEAQNGVLSKAKIETNVVPSKASQMYNSTGGKIIRNTVKGVTGVAGASKLLGH